MGAVELTTRNSAHGFAHFLQNVKFVLCRRVPRCPGLSGQEEVLLSLFAVSVALALALQVPGGTTNPPEKPAVVSVSAFLSTAPLPQRAKRTWSEKDSRILVSAKDACKAESTLPPMPQPHCRDGCQPLCTAWTARDGQG
jgi:hypothetical protein